jgi:tRNA pseudouridine38-40 synthase
MRYLFQIGYLGTKYHGWQSQANAVGVQDVVEDALGKLLRKKTVIVASGRTDTGVHCVKQFFHADVDHELKAESFIQRMNSFLPRDIAIHSIRRIRLDAHARYDAFERAYEYKITRVKNPLLVGFAYYYFKDLDVPTMNRAAALLLGVHDFQCFSKVKTDVNHFICEMKKAQWNQKKDILVFSIVANRFLRGMVRAVVGTLLEVGAGSLSMKEFQEVITSKDRKKAGMNVPAEGLYLVDVKYPSRIFVK